MEMLNAPGLKAAVYNTLGLGTTYDMTVPNLLPNPNFKPILRVPGITQTPQGTRLWTDVPPAYTWKNGFGLRIGLLPDALDQEVDLSDEDKLLGMELHAIGHPVWARSNPDYPLELSVQAVHPTNESLPLTREQIRINRRNHLRLSVRGLFDIAGIYEPVSISGDLIRFAKSAKYKMGLSTVAISSCEIIEA